MACRGKTRFLLTYLDAGGFPQTQRLPTTAFAVQALHRLCLGFGVESHLLHEAGAGAQVVRVGAQLLRLQQLRERAWVPNKRGARHR